MSEEKKPFTVSDRRHFTSEGEVRNTDEGGAASGPASGGEAGPAKEPSPDRESPPAAPAAASPGPEATEADSERGSRYPTDFLGLLISLGAQASTLLMPGPEGEPPELDGAHALIELLGVLKEKTEGHRTPQEDQLVDGLLYELRMAYVQASKAGGR
jgi:uncharacterized protein DUF1844